MARIFIKIIRLYQKLVRPTLPNCCRFYPSCSQYSLEVIEKYGVMKGTVLSLWRIARCSPLSWGGCDPVK